MLQSLFIILNLILLEVLLSIDNAAVLAAMVQDLPKNQQNKALKYGIMGAYAFRGLCLVCASVLIEVLWLKIIGGAYLCWLCYKEFKPKTHNDGDQDSIQKDSNFIFRKLKNVIGLFWTTVVLVEMMDMAFSLDNIFAAVAFSKNIYLVLVGVFIGIFAMRFVAQAFIKLLHTYPQLERVTFIVIGILGVKLTLSGICDYIPDNFITPILNSHITDMFFSVGILIIFSLPIIFKNKKLKTI